MNNDTLIKDLLNGISDCECGKAHKVTIEDVVIEEGALHKIPAWLKKKSYKNVYIVCDKNTYNACGKELLDILNVLDFNINTLIFERNGDLVPDERALAEVVINLNHNTDIIVAVGSGVINDTCKYIAHKLQIPYIIVATAPSMDGYASNTSALTINNLKSSLAATLPRVIFADINVLKKSPEKLILAGFGDIVGKYSALKDWRLSNIINQEYICEYVYELVAYSINDVCKQVQNIKSRAPEGIKALMDTLILTGIAMSFVGNSRPASGAEHHLSHYLEIQGLLNNLEIPLHGTKVAANTVLTQKLRERFVANSENINIINIKEFDINKWKNNIIEKYKAASEEVLVLNEKKNLLSQEDRKARLQTIIENKETIINLLSTGPSSKELINLLESIGLDYNFPYMETSVIADSVIYAKDLRDRYTIAHLLWDLDLSEEYSKYIYDEYSTSKLDCQFS